jgi:hypothetical protein
LTSTHSCSTIPAEPVSAIAYQVRPDRAEQSSHTRKDVK